MSSNQAYFEANRASWNQRTLIHQDSEFYDIPSFKAGQTSLNPIELALVGEVEGKRLLHLQCHFGQDTISWARMGAKATGVDFSEKAVDLARQLSAEEANAPDFVCCNVLALRDHLQGEFDIVFTSYGTIYWLPDLEPWADVVRHFLAPGGRFYLVEFHPSLYMLDDETMSKVHYHYFNKEVIEGDSQTYTDGAEEMKPIKDYGWNHHLSEVLTPLLARDLQLRTFQEFDYSPYNCFESTVETSPGRYQIKGQEGKLPMVYAMEMELVKA